MMPAHESSCVRAIIRELDGDFLRAGVEPSSLDAVRALTWFGRGALAQAARRAGVYATTAELLSAVVKFYRQRYELEKRASALGWD